MKRVIKPIALLAGIATALIVGVAFAKTFTLNVANSKIVNGNTGAAMGHENIAVTSKGRAVYTLSGDSKSHPECTKADGCFVFWPPLKVSSANNLSKATGISGKLGTWSRDGFIQVTLAGHPLYRFAADNHADVATGQNIHTFGGTWHVVKATGPAGTTPTGTTGTTPTYTYTMPTTTTTTTCKNPPYCY